MENILKLLGKPVISIYNGNLQGYVKNVLVDKKFEKILWLEIFDDESQDEKLVDMKSVFSLNNDAVMTKNDENTYIYNTINANCINPIGFKVYCLNGKYDSKIADLFFDEKLKINSILLQNGSTLLTKNIFNIGDNIVIKSEQNVKLSNFKPKAKIRIENNVVDQKIEAMDSKNVSTIKAHPNKILTAGYEFLIGRKVGQNIYSETKQLLIKKNSKITGQIIDIASQNGKLKELTTYSIA